MPLETVPVPFSSLLSSFFLYIIDSKIRYEESTRDIVRTSRAHPRRREVRCRRPRGTLTATCAILTAATRFDNYNGANGCERYVFSWDPTSGRRGAAEDGGTKEERRGALLPEDPFPQMPVRPLARTADYRLT